VAKVQ